MGDLVSMRVSMSASLAVFFCCCSLLFVGSVAWPSDETLIRMTEEFWLNSSGWYSPFRNETFAPDFVFRGPDIGPLNYNDNYRTLSGNGENSSSPYHAFPDITPNSRLLCDAEACCLICYEWRAGLAGWHLKTMHSGAMCFASTIPPEHTREIGTRRAELSKPLVLTSAALARCGR